MLGSVRGLMKRLIDNIIKFNGKSWELIDPTLAANNDNKDDVKEYVEMEIIMHSSIVIKKGQI